MRVSREDFSRAAGEVGLSEEQAEALWRSLQARSADRARFDLPNVAYYFGALIVISAMGIFMTLGWESFGGGGIFLISLAYALAFVLTGRWLWREQETRVPGGLLFTMAVCMTPLAVYGLGRATGFWLQTDPGEYRDFYYWVRGSWLPMELATWPPGWSPSGSCASRSLRPR